MKKVINFTPSLVRMFYVYGKLLPEKTYHRTYLYIVEDLSISEIAINEKISRACCYESILSGINKLEYYEEKLGLSDKINRLYECVSCYNEKSADKLIQDINEIMEF